MTGASVMVCALYDGYLNSLYGGYEIMSIVGRIYIHTWEITNA